MISSTSPTFDTQNFETWQELLDWANSHCRQRIFSKDTQIPTRPGLLYLVTQGAVRLSGFCCLDHHNPHGPSIPEEVFLGLIRERQPFEIPPSSPSLLQAYAHLEKTSVIWLYWDELERTSLLYLTILEMFRYQHQRKLLLMSILGQKRTVDRLMGFLSFLATEYGELTEHGYSLSYTLTHAHIASAIGTTRVTVTRLMGAMKQEGLLTINKDNSLYLKI